MGQRNFSSTIFTNVFSPSVFYRFDIYSIFSSGERALPLILAAALQDYLMEGTFKQAPSTLSLGYMMAEEDYGQFIHLFDRA